MLRWGHTLQPAWTLGRAPCFANQSIDIRAQECAGMVYDKERIKFHFFELALARDTSSFRTALLQW